MDIMQVYELMAIRMTQSQAVMNSLLKVIILEHSGQGTAKLLLIRQFATYGTLRLMQFGRRDHLHGRSDLQRIPDRIYPGLYFL
jgi:hypothetical protein